ncbi:HAD hydrolase-like protein, partial [Ligilactobacillus murinus]
SSKENLVIVKPPKLDSFVQLRGFTSSQLFFKRAFEQIAGFDKAKTLIIGDSLSSDMLGGQNAGIDTLWLNRKHQVADPKIKIDLEASSLEQISDLLS